MQTQQDVNMISFPTISKEVAEQQWLVSGKRTMQTISKALEDGALQTADSTIFYAGFQKFSYFPPHINRYRRLASRCRHVYVFGIDDVELPRIPNLTYVPLREDAPLADEWFIVYDSPDFFSTLIATDVSGFDLPEEERCFKAVWTFDVSLVEQAERILADALTASRLLPDDQPLYRPISRTASNYARQREREMLANRLVLGKLEERNDQLNTANIELAALQQENSRLQDLLRGYVAGGTWAAISRAATEGRTTIEPQVREATILFSDIVRFTSLSEKLPPIEVVQLLNDYFNLLAAVIYPYGGEIDKYIGDSMMVVFDDPRSALRAAEALLTANAAFNRNQQAQGRPTLQTRVGLAKGSVILGNIGDSTRTDRTHIGDAVNVASRLQELTLPDTVLATEDVWLAAGSPRGYQQWVEMQVRGRQTPLTAYLYHPGASGSRLTRYQTGVAPTASYEPEQQANH